MKKLISTTILAFGLMLGLGSFATQAVAQTTVTSTTLSAAIDNQQTVFSVASATGITNANGTNYVTMLFVDKEFMGVASISGTSVTVQRSMNSTGATSHASGAKVWLGSPSVFGYADPSGSCTATKLPYLPYIATLTGSLWNCGNGQWTTFDTFSEKMIVGTSISSTGSGITIAPTNPVFHVTGTGSIATITPPPACPSLSGCRLYIIPDAIFTTTTAGNIALASTAVVSKVLVEVWDPVAAKWFPSY